MPSLEVLSVLADEVSEVVDGISSVLSNLSDSSSPECTSEALAHFAEQAQRIGAATEILNLTGLRQVSDLVNANVTELQSTNVSTECLSILFQYPNLVLEYLRSPKDPKTSAELVENLQDTRWPIPLTIEKAEELKVLLTDIEEEAEEGESGPTRATEANPEDVLLEIPPDVNPILVEAFLAEGPVQANTYTLLITQVINGTASLDALNEARRVIHAIKGEANTVGVRGAAALTHHLEDLLEYLAEKRLQPQGDLAKLLMDVADCLDMMFEALLAGEPAPSQSLSILQRLLNIANAIDRGEAIEAELQETDPNAPESSGPSSTELETNGDNNVQSPNNVNGHKLEAAPTPKIRIEASSIEEILRLSGEIAIGRSHMQERLHQTTRFIGEIRELHNQLQKRANELDRIITVQGIAAGEKLATASESNVKNALFDALELDQYSELHGMVHNFVEIISELQDKESHILDTLSVLGTAVNQQNLINTELHEHVMRSRMISATTIEPRLLRTVRQVCDTTGKRTQLTFYGGDVMLDNNVVNDLITPLSHMLRNAIDHGIEPPEMRIAANKLETGMIELSFKREGHYIVIRCEDDGAGLDLHRIYSTAVERGFVDEGADLKEHEIAQLILLPGFTTTANVSEVSGRGVGMDIVFTNIRKLKGTLDIQTELGKGCCFTIRLPMTLGTAHCLLVKTAGQMVAIPSDSLDHASHRGASDIQKLGSRWIYREKREKYDVYDLAKLLNYAAEHQLGKTDDTRSVLLTKDPKGKKAVIVDSIFSARDLVIKSLGQHFSRVNGIIGASLLGDGRVIPVLDIQALIRMQRKETSAARPYLVHSRAIAQAQRGADILVIDDSLSVRQAMSQLLSGEGYEVHTAKDGIEALESLTKLRPAAIVVDLEMPRMNGLEFTACIRTQKENRGLPVIMITSRSSEKHRKQAEAAGVNLYLTKPYRESDLLTNLRSMINKAAA